MHTNRVWSGKRLLATLMAAGAATGLLLVNTAAPAAAATAGCGSRCDKKDPSAFVVAWVGPSPQMAVTCAQDAGTLLETNGVELRYSPYCRTAWARQGAICPGCRGYITIVRYNADGTKTTYGSSDSWTPMVNDKGVKSKACIRISYGADTPDTNTYCTDAR